MGIFFVVRSAKTNWQASIRLPDYARDIILERSESTSTFQQSESEYMDQMPAEAAIFGGY